MQDDTIREVEQFLYREARLLDARRFDDWLDLLTDDIKYWMPLRSNRYPAYSKAISILDGSRYEEGDLSHEDELAIMDEDKDSLTRRIRRLDSGMAWAEDPPSRTRHFVSNVEVEPERGNPSCGSTPTSSCTAPAARPRRTSTSAAARTSCAARAASSRSPTAR